MKKMLVPSDAGPGLTASEKILIVLIFFDVFSVTTSFVLLFLGNVTQETIFNSDLLVSISIVLGIYGSLSIICNILACYGITKGKHYFLIPYLVFFPIVISLLGVLLSRLLWLNGVNYYYYIALPFIASLLLAYVWIKLLKQWAMLRHQSRRTSTPPQTLSNRWPEDEDDNHVVENLNIIACYLSTGNMVGERDLLPQYESIKVISEDLDLPPSYDDVVKGQQTEI